MNTIVSIHQHAFKTQKIKYYGVRTDNPFSSIVLQQFLLALACQTLLSTYSQISKGEAKVTFG